MSTTKINITEKSKTLFLAYAKDAGNWSGNPLVGGNVHVFGDKEDRGNLTQLKRAGLLKTFVQDGLAWIEFTDLGLDYAKENGVDLDWVDESRKERRALYGSN
jgi:hypothetical protein